MATIFTSVLSGLFNKVNFKWLVFTTETLKGAFQLWVDFRQLKMLEKKEISQDVKDLGFDDEKFMEHQEYSAEKHRFGMCRDIFCFIVKMCWIYFDGYAFFWNMTANYVDPENEFYRALAFIAIDTIIDEIIGIPISIYETFVLEEKYGFNKQTPLLFIKDWLISQALKIVMTPIILKIIMWAIVKGGKYFYLYVLGVIMILLVVFMEIYPNLIQPLFNKYTELGKSEEPPKRPEGIDPETSIVELRSEIDKMAGALKFPLKKIFLVDGSKRSSHSNAYQFGFGSNKRIVIFDTLLHQMNNTEVMAILWHELGHWWHGHIYQILGQQLFGMAGFFFSYAFVKDNYKFFNDFGLDKPSIFMGLSLFSAMFSPLLFLNHIFSLAITRKNEFQADRFAVEKGMGQELRKALVVIFKENKGQLNTDHIYSVVHHSHPTLVERAKQIDILDKQLHKQKY